MNEVRNLGDFEPTSFDYSQLDDETSVFLKQRVRNMESIADDTRYRMGKELFRAQERLADHYKGTFVKWFESLGLDKDNVYFWINEFKFSRNLENTKQALNFGSAPKSLKKDVMKKNAPSEAKQAVLNGDITTHKEYVALEKKLKQREQELSDKDAQIADQQAELEDNRKTQLELNNRLAEANKRQPEPEVVTKTVTKEVHVKPDDYDTLKQRQSEYEQKYERLTQSLEAARAKERDARNEMKSLAKEHDELERKYQEASQAISDSQVEWAKNKSSYSTYRLASDSNDFITKHKPLDFQIEELANASDSAKKQLEKSMTELINFATDIKTAVSGKRIIEGEMIDHD